MRMTHCIRQVHMLCLLLCIGLSAQAQQATVLPMDERAKVIDEILEDRMENLLPSLMAETGIDLWVLISREYNEDPVLKTFLPSTWLNARRRTILVFYRNPNTNQVERLAVARYKVGKSIEAAWDKEKEPDQWKRLMEIISERNPTQIGLNMSDDHNIADGLDHTDYRMFMENLPKKFRKRVVSAEQLAVRWIETRTDREMVIYNQLVEITHDIIAEAFSEKVITPGYTTTSQVEWWMRQKARDLGLTVWFHPTVDIQRSAEKLKGHLYSFSDRPEEQVILPGDLLHCDFGITYLRLSTDCQELAYVRKPGEYEAPAFLKEAFKQGNRVQDILTMNMKEGLVGNAILLNALEQGKSEGLRPAIYTHPLGSYGHSAGTTIGMWDAQGGVNKADGNAYPLRRRTVYAIELNTTVYLEEWKRDIRVMLEEAGYFGPEGFRYVSGRQTDFLLIPRVNNHLGEHLHEK